MTKTTEQLATFLYRATEGDLPAPIPSDFLSRCCGGARRTFAQVAAEAAVGAWRQAERLVEQREAGQLTEVGLRQGVRDGRLAADQRALKVFDGAFTGKRSLEVKW
jgi:hypothetical protein